MAKILIVDDEPQLTEVLGYLLEAWGYEIGRANNSDEAFKKASENNFDLVLTDIRMPGGSGIDLLNAFRVQFPSLAVIAMSGFSDYTEEDLIEKGFAGYLSKPFNHFTAKKKIEDILAGTNK